MQVKPVVFFLLLVCFGKHCDLTPNRVWICSCYRMSWISNRLGKLATQNVNVTNLTSGPLALRSSSSTFGERRQRLSCPMCLCTWCVESQLSYCWGCAGANRLKVSLERAQFLSLVLPPWAKVVPSTVIQQYCPPHHPKQSSLIFWENSPKLHALIWKRWFQSMGLMPVKFNRKAAYSKIPAGFLGLLESLRLARPLKFNFWSLWEILNHERINSCL